ncbi:MAG: hypothetical protein AAGC77_13685, partial [Pseudomonadota bacterium]
MSQDSNNLDSTVRASGRDLGLIVLRGGIACLIAAIIAVLSGVHWPGGPEGAIIEPFVVHCTLTALGLAVCAHLRWRRISVAPAPELSPTVLLRLSFVLLAFSPIAVIGVNGYLVYEAIRAGGDKIWAVVFVIPALLAFLSWGGNANEGHRPDADVQKNAVARSIEGFWGTFKAHLRQTYFIVFFLTMMVLGFFVGSVYARSIRIAFLEDRFTGWDVFIRVFEDLDQWDILEMAVPLIAVALVYPLFGIVAGIWAHFRRGGREDFDRNLTEDEEAAIERYARDVEEYVASVSTAGASWIMVAWSLGFLLFIPLTFLFLDGGLGASIFEPMRAPAKGWYIYNDGPGGGEAMAFVTLFAAWCLLLAASPLISEKMVVLSFESNAQNNLRGETVAQMLRRLIAVDIRRRDILPGDHFDPAEYLKQTARKSFRITKNATLGLGILTLGCFAADRADFELITERGIKYRNYLSTNLIEATYSDIAEIDLTCRMSGADDERSISLHYRYIIRNGDEIYILSATNPREARFRIPRRLDAWEKADVLARDAGAP